MQTHQPLRHAKDRHTVSRTPAPAHQRVSLPLPQPAHPAALIQRATVDPGSLTRAEALHLQRTLGNRAMGQLLSHSVLGQQRPIIQAKLTVNAPGDKHEQEADRVALLGEEQVRTSLREPLSPAVQRQHGQENENTTGIPDHLKAGIENLSGLSLDDVKVHYNSSKPARLQALAYTQDTDIHVGVGQEKHLAHEVWHVVQQKQGRVRPTLQMKDGVAINDDAGLEKEADVMGTKALQMGRPDRIATDSAAHTATAVQRVGETRDASEVAGAAMRSPEEKVRWNFLSTYYQDLVGGLSPQQSTVQPAAAVSQCRVVQRFTAMTNEDIHWALDQTTRLKCGPVSDDMIVSMVATKLLIFRDADPIGAEKTVRAWMKHSRHDIDIEGIPCMLGKYNHELIVLRDPPFAGLTIEWIAFENVRTPASTPRNQRESRRLSGFQLWRLVQSARYEGGDARDKLVLIGALYDRCVYIPFKNDCHTYVDKVLERAQLHPSTLKHNPADAAIRTYVHEGKTFWGDPRVKAFED